MNILTLLEIAAAAGGDRVAIGDRDTGLTYVGLLDLVARTARHIDGDDHTPVLYATTAAPAFPVALFAAAWNGRPFAPLSYRLGDEPLRRLIAGQAPALLIAEDAVLGLAAAEAGVTGTGPEDLLKAGRAALPTDRVSPQDPDAAAVLLHTSGTTGTPKVAVLRHRHLTSYVLESTELLSAAPDEAALVSVPPYHIAGVAGLLTGIYSGRRIVQLPNFDAATWVRLAREQQVTHAMVVPTMLARIIEVLRADGGDLPSLRHLSYGGGRMPRPIIEQALRLLPEVDFVNGYGLTETTSSIAVLSPQDHRDAVTSADPRVSRRLDSVGRPLPAVEIVVRDSDGAPVPAGSSGELWVRGPQVSGEYAHASQTEEGGWFRTRDGGWIDENGYVYVEGRLDDVIVRGGENLSPGEIESVLTAHPAVAEAAVFGVPDEQWGEVVAAAIVSHPDAAVSAQDLRDWVAARLRSSRVPALIGFYEILPRNDMGKLLRRVLRADLETAGPSGT